MKEIIQKRKMLSPVRLELSRELDSSVVKKICDYIGVEKKFVFMNKIPLDLSFVFHMQDVVKNEEGLFYQKSAPQQYTQFSKDAILPQIKEKDRLLSYPYDSISPFLRTLHEAAHDKDVVAIKMTLYRVAKNSEVVESLSEAAENGKESAVCVRMFPEKLKTSELSALWEDILNIQEFMCSVLEKNRKCTLHPPI